MPSATLLHEMAQRRRDEAREADRDRLRDFVRAGLECMGWCALGLFGIAWGVHTTDPALGQMAFWGGLGVGNVGWLFSVLGAYRRGERRGDW